MRKKKAFVSVLDREYHNEDIVCYYELEFGSEIIKPGDKVKIKNQRGLFVFKRLAHNVKLDSTWVDLMEEATQQTRSFHVDKIRAVVRPKRSRRKKLVG